MKFGGLHSDGQEYFSRCGLGYIAHQPFKITTFVAWGGISHGALCLKKDIDIKNIHTSMESSKIHNRMYMRHFLTKPTDNIDQRGRRHENMDHFVYI